MIRVNLPTATVAHLEEVFRTTAEVELRHRAQIVPMARRGRPRGEIATDLGCSRSSVRRWLNAYLERGLDSPTPRKAAGAKPELTPDLAPVIRQWVIDGPAKHGPDRANWTYPESADHPYKTTGLRVGRPAPQAFGARHGIRPCRPAYRFLRGDPDKRAKAREESAALKKAPPTGNSPFWVRTGRGSRWSRP